MWSAHRISTPPLLSRIIRFEIGSSGIPGRHGSKPRMKHGLNTDQDSEQGKEEKSDITERGCVSFSNFLLDRRFIRGKNSCPAFPSAASSSSSSSNSPSPVLIRVQSVAKYSPK